MLGQGSDDPCQHRLCVTCCINTLYAFGRVGLTVGKALIHALKKRQLLLLKAVKRGGIQVGTAFGACHALRHGQIQPNCAIGQAWDKLLAQGMDFCQCLSVAMLAPKPLVSNA